MAIHQKMAEINNSFHCNFENSCQLSSIPIELVTLISMLIDGASVSNEKFSQPALTCTQQHMYNFHLNQKRKSTLPSGI